MFERALVAFDGSERGLDALALADTLTSPDGELLVCCVHNFQALSARIDPTEPRLDRESAQKRIADATAMLSSGAKVTPLFPGGATTASALLNVAEEKHADLLVLGSSHRGALGRVFVGSASREVIHAAVLPVAIAPSGFHRRDVALGRVAVAYDVVEPVRGSVPTAVGLCEETGAELLVVAVAEDRAVSDPHRATMPYAQVTAARLSATDQTLAEVLAGLPAGVSARSEVRDGDPGSQLVEVTGEVDLLVLGSHARGLAGRLMMGSVCDAVVRGARCAVLVVPPSGIPDALEFERRNLHRRAREDLAALGVAHEELQRTPEAGV